MILRLVADDLTGALDSAAQFCTAERPVLVLPRPNDVASSADGPAMAVNLASREVSRDVALAAASGSASFLATGEPAFKKVDSLLRGHWAAELSVTLASNFSSCVFAPAFPAQGRITRQGRLFAPSETGSLAEVGEPLRDRIKAEGLGVAERGGQIRCGEALIHIFDAETQADLEKVVVQGRRLPAPVLWCGSAGLAAALAGRSPPPAHPAPAVLGSTLIVVGTDHPVTQRQLSWLMAAGATAHIRVGASPAAHERVVRSALARGPVLLSVDIPGSTGRAEAGRLIASGLSEILPRLDPPDSLVVVGGETLLSVCDALGVQSLSVVGQYAPGIPVSTISGGSWARTRIFSKSGAFGGPEVLASMVSG